MLFWWTSTTFHHLWWWWYPAMHASANSKTELFELLTISEYSIQFLILLITDKWLTMIGSVQLNYWVIAWLDGIPDIAPMIIHFKACSVSWICHAEIWWTTHKLSYSKQFFLWMSDWFTWTENTLKSCNNLLKHSEFIIIFFIDKLNVLMWVN